MRKVRLGPIAIFLTVVAMVLSTMAVLTVSTSHADKALTQRFADVTKTRYALEAEGQRFLQQVDEQIAGQGEAVDAEKLGAERVDGGVEKELKKNGYTLRIRVSDPDKDGNFTVKQWKIVKDWKVEDPYSNVWQGEE